MQKKFLTLPNILTLFRFLSTPLFVIFWLAFDAPGNSQTALDSRLVGLWACLIITILSEVTDALDGIIARKLNQVSDFGKIMDPYADSIFRLTAIFCFASGHHYGPWLPMWPVLVMFWRDFGTSMIRTFAMRQGVAFAARFWGKAKAIAQAGLIIAVLVLAVSHPSSVDLKDTEFHRTASTLLYIVMGISVWSLITYLWAYFRAKKVEDTTSADDSNSDAKPEITTDD